MLFIYLFISQQFFYCTYFSLNSKILFPLISTLQLLVLQKWEKQIMKVDIELILGNIY